MTTTIKKRITGVQMVTVFNENNFIRYFETKKLKDIQELHTYKITIRHNEDEDPNEVLENALKNI
ncbi:hypothetical protein ACMGDK_11625 [Chryseobacterium sp. DT-3]|uniref:hypothetical protein n=1 Tax=Chryseobacterium sp. DT-3 TaxID=3396164 RepID=UPI003F1B3439